MSVVFTSIAACLGAQGVSTLSSDALAIFPLASAPSYLASSSESSATVKIQDDKSCSPFDLRAASRLSFRQRFCLSEANLITPSFALKAAFFSAFGQLRNEPYVDHQAPQEYARRFGVYYARRAAQNTGELLAGYLDHEDTRPHMSGRDGFWNRTKAALLGVALTKNSDGENRLALAPIAGAFGSGIVGVACYRTHDSMGDGFRRSGISYSGYLGTALFREFKPDMLLWASHLHRKDTDGL